jgi:serine protease AprX
LPRSDAEERFKIAAAVQMDLGDGDGRLPLLSKLKVGKPRRGESWSKYRQRVGGELEGMANDLQTLLGAPAEVLYCAGTVIGRARPDQIDALASMSDVEYLEIDRKLTLTTMDNAIDDVDLHGFHGVFGPLGGKDVRVAVLDSGIDKQHPFLNLGDSVSTCGESDDIPGEHGTHCAGSIASSHPLFSGIAPDVFLINVKVLNHRGSGSFSDIVRGIDAALDREADILSMSLGFNHFPHWTAGGHDWKCSNGRCPLCTAVDNATALGTLCVVAAANEHDSAQALRNMGMGDVFDTELGCPGQARNALTVGAITKRTFQPASFSSRGPTSYGQPKPDIAAPGVNISSTVPAPRDASGNLLPQVSPSSLFDRMSGTSMATPIVAGAAALVIQARRLAGLSTAPAVVRNVLLSEAVSPLGHPANVVGAGRLNIGLLKKP